MADGRIYPLTFHPQFRDYMWGGRRLATLLGRDLPPGIVAESWEISAHPSAQTVVDAGYWHGRTLGQVMDGLAADLVGTRSADTLARGRFPLLVKLLDAHRDLSVQVHPDDAYARAHERGEQGKTEMWYVLHAEASTELILGLAPGVTRESLAAALHGSQDLTAVLHRLPARAGDAFCLRAGTIHALLAGAVVVEIQQTSDVTYRVFDWDRLGDDGRPRELHIDRALEVIDWDVVAPSALAPEILHAGDGMTHYRLSDCQCFVTEKVEIEPGAAFCTRCDGSTFEIWGLIEGSGSIEWDGGSLELGAVRFALLPAALGDAAFCADEQSTLLRCFQGEGDASSSAQTRAETAGLANPPSLHVHEGTVERQ